MTGEGWRITYVIFWWSTVLGSWGVTATIWVQDLTDPHLSVRDLLRDDVPMTLIFGALPFVALGAARWACTGRWRFGWWV